MNIDDNQISPSNKYCSRGVSFTIYLLMLLLLVACLPERNEELWPKARTIHVVELNNDSALELLWTRNVLTGRVITERELVAGNGIVFFVGSLNQNGQSRLIALESITGDYLWELEEVSTFDLAPKTLYVGYKSYVSGHHLATGEEIWKTKLPGARNVSYVNALHSTLYINTTGSYFFYVVDSNSGKLIDRSQEADIFNLNPSLRAAFANYPAITDQKTCSRAIQSRGYSAVVAIDNESGNTIWKTENNVISNAAASQTNVFVLTFNDELQILDSNSGKLIESIRLKPSINFFDIDINPQADGYQIAVDRDKNILFVLLGDSNQLFAFRIRSNK